MKRHFLSATILCSALVMVAALPVHQTAKNAPEPIAPKPREITLLFAGDIMQHMPQVEAAWNNALGRYNYDSCFVFIEPWVAAADIAIANLETTLAGKPYSGYPAFSSPDEIVAGLIHTGFDIAGTANNHCCDRGRTGVERTVAVLDSLGMMHFGTYIDSVAYKNHNPLIINKNGFRLALLNYTYGTNGNPVPAGNVVSLIEHKRMAFDLVNALKAAPDKVIVFIHWGDEYLREQNVFQKETAQFLFDRGADIIIGSHPHVIQPMEWHKPDSASKERFIAWSLGNSVSNQRKRYTDGGAMVRLRLKKNEKSTYIADAGYLLTWVYNPVINNRKQYFLLPAARYENDSILVNNGSLNELRLFLLDSRKLLESKNLNTSEINSAFDNTILK